VPSTSSPPRSTHFGSTAPLLAPPSSSSSVGVLRVLKGMLAWCRDTHQCQDVLLNNKRCLNEKLGIDEFNGFSLLVPLLEDDPFSSLSTTDLAAMEAAPDSDDEEEFGSEYVEEDDDDE
jgi:hypothetical protein